MTADFQMQGDVLAEVLREAPDVLTLEELASRVLENPRSLSEGIMFASALRKLDDEDLAISDGVLIRPTRRAVYLKQVLDSAAILLRRSAR